MPKQLRRNQNTILIVSTIVSTVITGFFILTILSVIDHEKSHVQQSAETVAKVVEGEIHSYIYGLQGAKATIIAENYNFDPKMFRRYAESRDMFKVFNGSLGFGFIRYVKSAEINKYLQQQKAIRPFFNVHPKIDIEQHMIIELIEPIERNLPALGLDIAFEENRREAAIMAAITGQATLTKNISLVQEQSEHNGMLYLLPIYSTIDTPNTTEERLEKLIGWTYTPIILELLFKQIQPKLDSSNDVKLVINENIELKMTDDRVPNSLFIDLSAYVDLAVGGQVWRLKVERSNENLVKTVVFITLAYLVALAAILYGGIQVIKIYKNQERTIIEKTSWLNAILQSAGHAVIATNPSGQITFFNSAAEKLLGYTASEVILKNTPLIFYELNEETELTRKISQSDPSIQDRLDSLFKNAKSGITETKEYVYINRSHSKIPVSVCTAPILDGNGQLIGFLQIAEDLSEKKKLMSTIELQRAKMAEGAKMSILGEMAGGIAHEINTPLAIILAKTELMMSKVQNNRHSHTELLENFEKIRATTLRIAKIVKGLRSFSRNSENDPLVKIDAREIVDSTLDLCREKLKNKGIDLIVDVKDSSYVIGNPTQLSQVLMNLISNAADAIEEKSDKWIKVAITTNENHTFVTVTDSGQGIPKDVVEKMMAPFFTTKEAGRGTGLGLSLSKGIIEMHNGQLYYDKESPNTRFVIDLPKA